MAAAPHQIAAERSCSTSSSDSFMMQLELNVLNGEVPSATPSVLLRDTKAQRQSWSLISTTGSLSAGTALPWKKRYAKSAKIGSAPSSPLAGAAQVTTQRAAPSFPPAKISSAPSSPLASTELSQAFPEPAAASRERWFTGAAFVLNKAAALRAKQQGKKLTVATATACSSSRSWYHAPLRRSASTSKARQLQLVSQPLLQQEQIIVNGTKGRSTRWQSVSRSSSPHHLQQGVRSFEVDDTAFTRSANDHRDGTSELATPVPDAVLNRDAAWPPVSKVSRREAFHSVAQCVYNVSLLQCNVPHPYYAGAAAGAAKLQ
jgi:hypothetical protein